MSISHKNIRNNNKPKRKRNNKLQITMLAPAKAFKGYLVLIDALDNLWKEGNRNFILNMYSPIPENREYIRLKEEGFTQEQLADIFEQTDVLVAPSVWYETFGFTVMVYQL